MMDMSTVGLNLRMVQSAVSTLVLDKAMGMDAQSMQTLLTDMLPAASAPAPAPPSPPGSMDIRV